MLDLSHIPNSQQDIQIFQANGSAWQTWRKPKKCNYVYIMCIGGGGGGAGGFNSTSTVYASGGAGGAVSRALYNAQQLSDILYVQVGLGGGGGAAQTAGSAGTRSFVALQPVIGPQNLITISGNAGAAGGRVDGANAAGETVSTQATATFYTLSNFISSVGNTSVGSVSLSTPPNITPLNSQITSQGAGGGGGPSVNGGSILATSISPLIEGGEFTTINSAIGGRGADGITSFKPFYSLGGAGGGNSSGTSGIGGNGGNGGIGCGGGAGGNGTTGGTGGRGGDGLVIIISF